MIAIFDEDGGGDVDFQEFVSGLSAFSSKGNKEEKLKFAFKVYDIDRDGYISNGELFIVLKMMVGSNLKDQQLQQIVDKTIMEADLDHDGKISFAEFQKMVENTDVSMSMTLGEDDADMNDIGGDRLIECRSILGFHCDSSLITRGMASGGVERWKWVFHATRRHWLRMLRVYETLSTYESGCLLCFNCTPLAFSHA